MFLHPFQQHQNVLKLLVLTFLFQKVKTERMKRFNDQNTETT